MRRSMSGGSCKRLSSREWSSTDSSGYRSEDESRLRRSLMAKANSYGGKPTIHLSPSLRTCSLNKAGIRHRELSSFPAGCRQRGGQRFLVGFSQ